VKNLISTGGVKFFSRNLACPRASFPPCVAWMGVGINIHTRFQDPIMKTFNENKCPAGSSSVGSTVRQRRFSDKLAPGSLAILGIALATGLVVSFGFQQTEVAKSIVAPSQSAASTDSFHNTRLSTNSPLQAPIPSASPDSGLDALSDFVSDGLEFTLAGAELSNQFGTYKEIGNTVSWLGQVLSQPEDTPQLASQLPTDASLVAMPALPQHDAATWSLQNSPWTR
jgi:hypothetical protein